MANLFPHCLSVGFPALFVLEKSQFYHCIFCLLHRVTISFDFIKYTKLRLTVDSFFSKQLSGMLHMFVSFYVVQYYHIYVYFILFRVHIILLLSVNEVHSAKNDID